MAFYTLNISDFNYIFCQLGDAEASQISFEFDYPVRLYPAGTTTLFQRFNDVEKWQTDAETTLKKGFI